MNKFKKEKPMQTKKNKKKSMGYTLLEYCAGAAIIAGVIWTAMNALGTNLSDLLNAIGRWTQNRTTSVSDQ